ncbi:glutaredoxin family protein [Arenimonas sp.]|nr:glutaredoxin family protein [Candidatus Parcubacteria bacterium]
MKIIAYLKTGCPWCVELKKFFDTNNIEYIEKNVTDNTDFMDEMIELSGQLKAPTIVIDEVVYADTDVEAIKKVLEDL